MFVRLTAACSVTIETSTAGPREEDGDDAGGLRLSYTKPKKRLHVPAVEW